MWRHQKSRSVCVKQALNTRHWLVNALVTWHVSYKITTLVRILFSFLSKEALSFDSKWFLSITFNSKIFLFFCVFFFLFQLWILSMHRWISDPLWCLSLLKSSVGSVKCHTQCELLRQQLPFDTGNTVEWKYFWNSIQNCPAPFKDVLTLWKNNFLAIFVRKLKNT